MVMRALNSGDIGLSYLKVMGGREMVSKFSLKGKSARSGLIAAGCFARLWDFSNVAGRDEVFRQQAAELVWNLKRKGYNWNEIVGGVRSISHSGRTRSQPPSRFKGRGLKACSTKVEPAC